MKNKFLLYGFWFLIIIIATGCYDDEGNYNYDAINEVGVGIEKTYGVRKVDTIFVIRPQIKQTLAKDTSNLKFEWYYNTFSDQMKGTLVSRADTVAVKIDPKNSKFSYNHFLRFYITDTRTGAKYLFPVKVKVIKPYEGAWMLLHTQNGMTKLGAVEYIGENMEASDDVYFKEKGSRLKGKPIKLGSANYFDAFYNPRYSPTTLLYCFTDDPEESGILMQDKGFKLYDSIPRYVYPGHIQYFDVTKMGVCEGEMYGRICICNGYLFQGSTGESKLYRVNPSEQVTGKVNITHGTCVGWTSLVFDSEGHRFLHFRNDNNSNYSYSNFDEAAENTSVMDYIKKDEKNVPGIDLNKIDENQKMVYMGSGYWYGSSMRAAQARMAAYALTINEKLNYTYVYEFHGYPLWGSDGEDYPFTYYAAFKTPSGITEKTPMASSCTFNRLLFYAVDNKIYRLDFGAGGNSTLIYQHPNAEAKVEIMRFARKDVGSEKTYEETFADYGSSVFRSLGIAFNLPNGNGEFVVLNLTSAGKVDKNGKYPSEQLHQKFGNIKDIMFI
ncbi:MAG: PKD-like family lipoprotein [Odoribacter sp.]